MVFLDSNIVIYYVEQPAMWGRKAANRLTALLESISCSTTGPLSGRCCIGALTGMTCFQKYPSRLPTEWRN